VQEVLQAEGRCFRHSGQVHGPLHSWSSQCQEGTVGIEKNSEAVVMCSDLDPHGSVSN
jgi:hypothetical protein